MNKLIALYLIASIGLSLFKAPQPITAIICATLVVMTYIGKDRPRRKA